MKARHKKAFHILTLTHSHTHAHIPIYFYICLFLSFGICICICICEYGNGVLHVVAFCFMLTCFLFLVFCILSGAFASLINWAIKINPQRFFVQLRRVSALHWVSHSRRRGVSVIVADPRRPNDGIIIQSPQYMYVAIRSYAAHRSIIQAETINLWCIHFAAPMLL